MRIFMAAAVAIALVTVPAHSQDALGGKQRHKTEQKTKPNSKKKISDKEYNDALAKIPDSKQKHDPWRNAR